MRLTTLSDAALKIPKETRDERFLDDMEEIVSWAELTEAVEPFYPNPQDTGRRPVGVERVLRIHFLQNGFNLSNPAAEEARYDFRAMRGLWASTWAANPAGQDHHLQVPPSDGEAGAVETKTVTIAGESYLKSGMETLERTFFPHFRSLNP